MSVETLADLSRRRSHVDPWSFFNFVDSRVVYENEGASTEEERSEIVGEPSGPEEEARRRRRGSASIIKKWQGFFTREVYTVVPSPPNHRQRWKTSLSAALAPEQHRWNKIPALGNRLSIAMEKEGR